MKYSFKKTVLLIGIFLVLFLLLQSILFIALFTNKKHIQTQQGLLNQESSPSAISYTIQYPSSWHSTQNIHTTDQTKRYIFTVDGKQYAFYAFQHGSIPLQSMTTTPDVVTDQAKIYQKRQFLIRIWSKNNIPFLIMALPNEADLDIDGFVMDLPSQNTNMYIAQFENLIATMHLNSPGPLTPLPSLLPSHIYTMTH